MIRVIAASQQMRPPSDAEVRAAQAELMEKGTYSCSFIARCLPALVKLCEESQTPYRLDATPGKGYTLTTNL